MHRWDRYNLNSNQVSSYTWRSFTWNTSDARNGNFYWNAVHWYMNTQTGEISTSYRAGWIESPYRIHNGQGAWWGSAGTTRPVQYNSGMDSMYTTTPLVDATNHNNIRTTTTTTEYSRGTYNGSVTSPNRNTYPDNGRSGSYWYVYIGWQYTNNHPTITITTSNNLVF